MNKQTKQLLYENNALAEQLDINYGSVLSSIVVYIRYANISEYQQEVVRRDITHIMLEGMRRGESPENIIGEDYKVFCDNVLVELPKMKMIKKILSFIRNTFFCLALLLTIWFCFKLIDLFMGEVIWPYFPVTAGDLINIGLIFCFSIVYVTILGKNSFNVSFSNHKCMLSLVGMLLVLVITLQFLNKVIFTLHAVIVIIGALVLFTIATLIDRQVLL
ncbi:MAG: hypothetical protein ACRC3H_05000 [Lachnospiraceae bacterium]